MLPTLVSLVALASAPALPSAHALPAPTTSTPRSAMSLPAAPAPRHELGQSLVFLRIYEDSLSVRVEVTTEDLEAALGFGWDPDAVTLDQVRTHLDSIRGWVEARFELATAAGPLALAFEDLGSLFVEQGRFVQLHYRNADSWAIPDAIDVTLTTGFDLDDDHRNLVVIEHEWRSGTFTRPGEEGQVALILSPRNPRQTLDLTSSTLFRGFVAFIGLGVWHIWIGIDHILFLMALTLPSVLTRREGRWQPVESFRQALFNIVAIVTFFTIAHSVTLAIAALGVVELPSRLVESIIAGSIAVAAFAALRPDWTVTERSIAFVFGLFHGFGFASVLGDIGMGRENLVLSLLGFNIGVELGQIAIICLAFPVLFFLRRTPLYTWILRLGSGFLIAVALLWMFERIFDFNVPLVPLVTAPFRWLAGG